MAVTANGLIAKEDDDASFVSNKSWERFGKMTKSIGNIIVGRRTYEVSLTDGTFPYPNCLNVVMTSKQIKNKWGNNVIFTKDSPRKVLQFLAERGFDKAFVAGGGTLNAGFMKGNLVDEIYLDVEPIVFGRGIKLFADEDFEVKLKLLELIRLSDNELHLHYKVLK